MKIVIKKEDIKVRNRIAQALFSDPQFKSKVVKSKKVYNRKKLKQEKFA